MKEWVVFFNKNTGASLCAYTATGTFTGELDATREFLASENGLSGDDIVVEVHNGNGPYEMGKGTVITENNIVSFDPVEKIVGAITALTPPKPRKAKLTFIGMGEFDCPAYQDEAGKVFLDINMGHGTPDLHTSSDGTIDGEPCFPISEVYDEWTYDTKYHREPREFDYQMLGRYKADCDYALYVAKETGFLYLGHLYWKSIDLMIEKMKNLFLSFKKSERPEWISLSDIEEYEQQMKSFSIKEARV